MYVYIVSKMYDRRTGVAALLITCLPLTERIPTNYLREAGVSRNAHDVLPAWGLHLVVVSFNKIGVLGRGGSYIVWDWHACKAAGATILVNFNRSWNFAGCQTPSMEVDKDFSRCCLPVVSLPQ